MTKRGRGNPAPDSTEGLPCGKVGVLVREQEFAGGDVCGVVLVEEAEVRQREEGLAGALVGLREEEKTKDIRERSRRPSHICRRILRKKCLTSDTVRRP